VCGIWIARLCLGLIVSIGADQVPRLSEARIELPLLLSVFFAGTFCGVGANLAPAIFASQVGLRARLASAGPTVTIARRRPFAWFLAIQVSVSTALMILIVLLAVSFFHLHRVETGLHITDALFGHLRLSAAQNKTIEARVRAIERIRSYTELAIPGHHVALSSAMPLSGVLPPRRIVQSRDAAIPAREYVVQTTISLCSVFR
jgi:hypothetical protein